MAAEQLVPRQPLRRRVRYLRHLIGQMPRPVWWGTVAVAVVSALGGGGVSLGLKIVLDGVAEGSATIAGAGVAIASVSMAVSSAAGRMYVNFKDWARPMITTEVSVETAESVATIPTIDHLERADHLDQVGLVTGGGKELADAVWTVLDTVVIVVRFAFTVGLLVTVHPIMALLPLASVPQLTLARFESAIHERARERAAEATRSATHLHGVFLDPNAGMELRLFGAASELDQRADTSFVDAGRIMVRAGVRATLVSSAGWLISTAGFVAALAVTLVGVARGWATAGDILLVAQLAAGLRGQTEAVTQSVGVVERAARTVDRVLWLRDLRDAAFAGVRGDEEPPEQVDEAITLEDVSFAYPGTDAVVLSNIRLRIPAGRTVAIVGENGAGKTTLVKLLCGLYRPTSGRILIDSTDLASFDPRAWRRRLSGAFQDHLNLEASLRESVGVGQPDRLHDDDAVLCAIEHGHATSVLADPPNGLESLLGKTYHAGQELSGGQWQRLSVARAMMRPEPLLMVLDEPTAALDPEAEHALYQRYATAAGRARLRGGITLLVSHRFSSVRMADLIVVLESGRVIEVGSHEQLMAIQGVYEQMFSAQATAYR